MSDTKSPKPEELTRIQRVAITALGIVFLAALVALIIGWTMGLYREWHAFGIGMAVLYVVGTFIFDIPILGDAVSWFSGWREKKLKRGSETPSE